MRHRVGSRSRFGACSTTLASTTVPTADAQVWLWWAPRHFQTKDPMSGGFNFTVNAVVGPILTGAAGKDAERVQQELTRTRAMYATDQIGNSGFPPRRSYPETIREVSMQAE